MQAIEELKIGWLRVCRVIECSRIFPPRICKASARDIRVHPISFAYLRSGSWTAESFDIVTSNLRLDY